MKRRLTRLECLKILREYRDKRAESTKKYKLYDRARRRIRGYGNSFTEISERQRRHRLR